MKRTMFKGAEKGIFERARELRNRSTHAEEILWSYLKCKPLGYKFRRQHPYSNYILDFYCHSMKLVIEVDGSIHEKADIIENDLIRQKALEDNGMVVLRFTNESILNELEDVINEIDQFLQKEYVK